MKTEEALTEDGCYISITSYKLLVPNRKTAFQQTVCYGTKCIVWRFCQKTQNWQDMVLTLTLTYGTVHFNNWIFYFKITQWHLPEWVKLIFMQISF